MLDMSSTLQPCAGVYAVCRLPEGSYILRYHTDFGIVHTSVSYIRLLCRYIEALPATPAYLTELSSIIRGSAYDISETLGFRLAGPAASGLFIDNITAENLSIDQLPSPSPSECTAALGELCGEKSHQDAIDASEKASPFKPRVCVPSPGPSHSYSFGVSESLPT